MRLRETLLAIPAVYAAGAAIHVKPPARLKLRLDPEWECLREEAERDRLMGTGKLGSGLTESGRPAWPYKVIPLKYWDAVAKRWLPAAICINLGTRAIEFERFTSTWLLGRGTTLHPEEFIISLLASSFTIPFAPALYLARKYYERQEKQHWMSRHGIALRTALKGQLDPETDALLAEALRNSWSREEM